MFRIELILNQNWCCLPVDTHVIAVINSWFMGLCQPKDTEPDELIISSSADHCDKSNTVGYCITMGKQPSAYSPTATPQIEKTSCQRSSLSVHCVGVITMVSRAGDDEFIRFYVY